MTGYPGLKVLTGRLWLRLMAKFKGKRGPKRQEGSAVKQRCGYKKCRSKAHDVKNSGFTLPRSKVDLDLCRPLRSHSAIVKFCSLGHMQKASMKAPKKKGRGREALDVEQAIMLFDTLNELGFVWAAVLMLFHLFLGERADAVRQLQVGWLRHFDPCSAENPAVVIPPGLNGKTWSREVSLPMSFARLVHSWMEQPLCRGKGNQWPLRGQSLESESDVLFPGVDVTTQRRSHKAVSERAYYNALMKAGQTLVLAREQTRNKGGRHVFEGMDLSRLGTHSFKKTHVTLMKTSGFSTALISSITGTSPTTLDKHYDVPTSKRQREALDEALGPILPGHRNNAGTTAFCTNCGQKIVESWRCCCQCGNALAACPSTRT